jgi:hypothetical protein
MDMVIHDDERMQPKPLSVEVPNRLCDYLAFVPLQVINAGAQAPSHQKGRAFAAGV